MVRRFIRTAIVFLAIGLLLGGWMIVRRELFGRYPNPYEVSAHVHALQVGFVVNMIVGVALWLFPRPDKDDRRYSPRLVEISYWLLTVGTAARVGGELLRTVVGDEWLRLAVAASGILQVAAPLLFFYTMWNRVRPLGSKAREAAGERF